MPSFSGSTFESGDSLSFVSSEYDGGDGYGEYSEYRYGDSGSSDLVLFESENGNTFHADPDGLPVRGGNEDAAEVVGLVVTSRPYFVLAAALLLLGTMVLTGCALGLRRWVVFDKALLTEDGTGGISRHALDIHFSLLQVSIDSRWAGKHVVRMLAGEGDVLSLDSLIPDSSTLAIPLADLRVAGVVGFVLFILAAAGDLILGLLLWHVHKRTEPEILHSLVTPSRPLLAYAVATAATAALFQAVALIVYLAHTHSDVRHMAAQYGAGLATGFAAFFGHLAIAILLIVFVLYDKNRRKRRHSKRSRARL